jgi:uncharacterized protein (TIGR03032 family)
LNIFNDNEALDDVSRIRHGEGSPNLDGADARTESCPPGNIQRDCEAPFSPFRSVHTTSFPAILERLGLSVLVTTYQAGKLVMLWPDGGVLNTDFRGFQKPMGLACVGDRLAVGTALEIWEYHDVPAVARRLAAADRHDACFLPRLGHCTGDIQIHEMAWGVDDDLWFVNTRFSCLCTRDLIHSFVPRWRPPFITKLAPDDRCHLNGICLVDGRPAFVTALGETDTEGGWRTGKNDGGVLIEVETGRVILRGLAMPHSPRWHDGRLWLLESGTGGFGYVDPWTRRYVRVAELPGFTRGLDIVGNLAFVGLSQVRESAIFSGIPIADRPITERSCGVWILDVNTGQTVAFVKFEDAVQEIFAVQTLPGVRCPNVINDDRAILADSFVIPTAALTTVPAPLRFYAHQTVAC